MRKYFFLLLITPVSLFAQCNAKLSPEATHIIMVRHGETDRNAAGKEIQGWIDDDAAQLNNKGQMQADQLGSLLAQRYQGKIAAIYSSPLGRAMQTAQRIAKYFPDIPLIEDRRFMEICHGSHDTMSFKERNMFCISRYTELEHAFKEKNPYAQLDRFFKWSINPLAERKVTMESTERFQESLETILQLFERASTGCEDLGRQHSGTTILIASHAGLIKTLADEAEYRERGNLNPLPVYYEPQNLAEFPSQYFPGNCSLYHFTWHKGTLSFIGTEDLLTPFQN